jgi:hypothetical protein
MVINPPSFAPQSRLMSGMTLLTNQPWPMPFWTESSVQFAESSSKENH